MAKKYANIVDMMRDITGDHAFADALADRLSRSRVVTKLVALRAAGGLTQKAVAKKLGCSQGRVSKIESVEDADLSLGALASYAAALGFRIKVAFVAEPTAAVDPPPPISVDILGGGGPAALEAGNGDPATHEGPKAEANLVPRTGRHLRTRRIDVDE